MGETLLPLHTLFKPLQWLYAQSTEEQQRAGLIGWAKHCKLALPCTLAHNRTDSCVMDEALLPMYACQGSISSLSLVAVFGGVDASC